MRKQSNLSSTESFHSLFLTLVVKCAMNLRDVRRVRIELDLLRYDNNDKMEREE